MRQLLREGEAVKLTGGEINLLDALVRNAGKPLSRERLLALARDEDSGERQDRKSVVAGKSVSVRLDIGGRRITKKKNLSKQYNSSFNHRGSKNNHNEEDENY